MGGGCGGGGRKVVGSFDGFEVLEGMGFSGLSELGERQREAWIVSFE